MTTETETEGERLKKLDSRLGSDDSPDATLRRQLDRTAQTCPICKEPKSTVLCSLQPMIHGDGVIPAGTYAVCFDCYVTQWNAVYSQAAGGLTFEEYNVQNRERYEADRLRRQTEAREGKQLVDDLNRRLNP